jgi:hypothetical protein
MRYLSWLLVFICLAGSASADAIDVRVSVSEVSDRRSTGQFFNNLEVKLRLTGDDAAEIKGINTVITSAVDDTRRNLLSPEKNRSGFEAVRETGTGPEVTLSLKNPARKATVIKELSGELQLFIPGRDPAATVLVKDIMRSIGKPIANPALEKAGISVIVLTKKEYDQIRKEEEQKAKNTAEKQGLDKALLKAFEGLLGAFFEVGEHDLILKISDPSAKLIEVEVIDGKGERISGQGSMKTGDLRILNYTEALPADAQLRIFLNTQKSVVSLPLKLADISLP